MPEILILTLLSIVPIGGPVRESVDCLHVNHFHDENGRLVFRQGILLLWNKYHSRFDVVAWRLMTDPTADGRMKSPERDWQRGGYVTTWYDGNTLRQIRTKSVIEDWTQHDPELAAREILPKEERKELRGVQWDKPSGVIRPQPSQVNP